jgi:diaminohydroxyphosphoribosylaminopyrimidine deaminase/5-amino-6-(5-phosphoribosylamino)uracil reductase
MAGIGTALADDPLLTARLPGARSPTRVVVDARAELPLNSQIGRTLREVPTIVAATGAAPPERRVALEAAGARVLTLPEQAGRVDLPALMQELARRELSTVLVEGGAELAAALVREDLVDRLIFFIAPKLLGGRTAPGPLGGEGLARLHDAIPVHDLTLRRFGPDIALFAYVHRPG